MYYQATWAPLNNGAKGDEEQKLVWLSQIWRERTGMMMMRLNSWSDVEEEESCLFILPIRISLTQLSNRIAKEINSFSVLVSSHTVSLSLMELDIFSKQHTIPSLHFTHFFSTFNESGVGMGIERRHC